MNKIRYTFRKPNNVILTEDEMPEFPMRNYLCGNYDRCLSSAAKENIEFNCENCRKFIQAEKQILSSAELGGMLSLWESVFDARVSIQ
ncbi:hypothetical protein QUF80_14040 [Desulfococcaceae bacterium HSG8]|nr:hypothetical protein [Desulfococcaceae bacterium HSG8]